MPEITLPYNGWRPRPYQQPLWNYLERGCKRAVAVWHRRAGKDECTLHWTACAAMQKPAVYWHMLPQAEQARKAIWAAINPHTGKRRIDEAFPLELRENTRENDMFIRFKNGSTWQVVGSDNYNSLVGSPPVGIVFSEWALSDPSSWAYLRPILRENGGWALFIYTPRGRNHGATTYESHKDDPEWFVQKLTAKDTDVFSPEALALEQREYIREFGKDDGESRFRQEYMCDFNVAVIGAYYGRQMTEAEDEGRITNVRCMKDITVDTWWDLGRSDPTSVWFVQHVAGEIRVIDHFSASYCEPAELAKMLQEKREQLGYTYGRHIAPHDAGHKRQGMAGKSLRDMFYDLGFAMEVQAPEDVQAGIVRTRQILDRCLFDREKCGKGIESLRSYHKEWSDKTRSYTNNPKHDWSSHDADAFRTGAVAYHEQNIASRPRKERYASQQTRRASPWAA
jgi:phage terminase large subunit